MVRRKAVFERYAAPWRGAGAAPTWSPASGTEAPRAERMRACEGAREAEHRVARDCSFDRSKEFRERASLPSFAE
eukprot:4351648-Prymnesium_polylepis.1